MSSKEEISNINLKDLIESETGQKFNRNNSICCPFHNEKTASFSVKKYNDKWRYYCYGCGRKGDIIDFIKEYKHMTYNEACKYLNLEVSKEYRTYLSLLDKVELSVKNIGFKDNDGKLLNYIKHIYLWISKTILYILKSSSKIVKMLVKADIYTLTKIIKSFQDVVQTKNYHITIIGY